MRWEDYEIRISRRAKEYTSKTDSASYAILISSLTTFVNGLKLLRPLFGRQDFSLDIPTQKGGDYDVLRFEFDERTQEIVVDLVRG